MYVDFMQNRCHTTRDGAALHVAHGAAYVALGVALYVVHGAAL